MCPDDSRHFFGYPPDQLIIKRRPRATIDFTCVPCILQRIAVANGADGHR